MLIKASVTPHFMQWSRDNGIPVVWVALIESEYRYIGSTFICRETQLATEDAMRIASEESFIVRERDYDLIALYLGAIMVIRKDQIIRRY